MTTTTPLLQLLQELRFRLTSDAGEPILCIAEPDDPTRPEFFHKPSDRGYDLAVAVGEDLIGDLDAHIERLECVAAADPVDFEPWAPVPARIGAHWVSMNAARTMFAAVITGRANLTVDEARQARQAIALVLASSRSHEETIRELDSNLVNLITAHEALGTEAAPL